MQIPCTSSYQYFDRFKFLLRNLYYYRHATLRTAILEFIIILNVTDYSGFSVLLNSPGIHLETFVTRQLCDFGKFRSM